MAGGGGGTEDLNLVPYMDIMVNLIMFMLVVTAYIIELRQAPVLAPSYSSDPGSGSTDKPKAFLTVQVTEKSLSVLASTPEEIPAQQFMVVNNTYPFADLAKTLRDYKSTYQVAPNLVVTADAQVPYSTVIATMDAVRGEKADLFPGVTLGLAVGQK
jgi:biopolymer transport protein ExbD